MMPFDSAEAAPDKLYPGGDGAFEFQLTVGRLMEMQSRTWLEAVASAAPGSTADSIRAVRAD
jgi:predicted ATPase